MEAAVVKMAVLLPFIFLGTQIETLILRGVKGLFPEQRFLLHGAFVKDEQQRWREFSEERNRMHFGL